MRRLFLTHRSCRKTLASHNRSSALLDHLARLTRARAQVVLEGHGLRPRSLVALTLLRDHGGFTQQGLAAALQIDKTNLVGLLNDLENDGLSPAAGRPRTVGATSSRSPRPGPPSSARRRRRSPPSRRTSTGAQRGRTRDAVPPASASQDRARVDCARRAGLGGREPVAAEPASRGAVRPGRGEQTRAAGQGTHGGDVRAGRSGFVPSDQPVRGEARELICRRPADPARPWLGVRSAEPPRRVLRHVRQPVRRRRRGAPARGHRRRRPAAAARARLAGDLVRLAAHDARPGARLSPSSRSTSAASGCPTSPRTDTTPSPWPATWSG